VKGQVTVLFDAADKAEAIAKIAALKTAATSAGLKIWATISEDI